ncbi:SDR family NAD(P)-dependent oxidoreductase [Flavobacterium psychrotrophum]|uniref:SDR family NAD(P)-dependent oxidoreductase n=1 Tax=Flavobacterium psychrotrophum TaxID=2294119 RepID=UPI000E3131B7|nr:glucose 1-dehydrogenase [Flavobacterium psychrotrophum]
MSLQLEGKVAIVTGASKGIGAGIAKSLAAAGAAVAVNYASDKAGADKAVSQITSDGGRAVAVQGSVTNTDDIQRLFEETVKTYGRVDILVNNAGVYKFDNLEDITKEEYDRQFTTNVYGPILASQYALKHFPKTGGSIINISSVVGQNPLAGAAVYSATKSALDGITKSLAKELGPKNIRVNVIAPGFTVTEGTHTAGIAGSDFETHLVSNTPLGRVGQPDDIARAVTFLASDASAWITGEVINVSGGLL